MESEKNEEGRQESKQTWEQLLEELEKRDRDMIQAGKFSNMHDFENKWFSKEENEKAMKEVEQRWEDHMKEAEKKDKELQAEIRRLENADKVSWSEAFKGWGKIIGHFVFFSLFGAFLFDVFMGLLYLTILAFIYFIIFNDD